MKSILHAMLVAFLVGVAFFAGRAVDLLEAQGRTGPPPAAPPRPPTEPGVTVPREPAEVLPYEDGNSVASESNGFLAVTGSYGVGTSVLYVIDTVHKQLAVYEGRGGSKSMRRIVLVGARRIDLDLKLEGYNDESEYDYEALRQLFARKAKAEAAGEPPPTTGGIGDRR